MESDDNLCCDICLKKYDLVETVPASLHCGHNYCLNCLLMMYRKSKPIIKCPNCSEESHF